jgi:allantoin racemase
MRLLVVNGNTAGATTDLMLQEARRAAAPGTAVEGETARFGAAFVSGPAHEVVAAHAVLDALARAYRGADAAILGISLDCGLVAARSIVPIPVVGMTEAALGVACMLGERFGLIAIGGAEPYRALAERYGVARRLAECRSLDVALLGREAQLAERIAAEARTMAATGEIGAVVICGAALTGMARRLQPAVPVPLLDGVACGVRQAEALVRGQFPPALHAAAVPAQGVTGVSPELAALLESPSTQKEP